LRIAEWNAEGLSRAKQEEAVTAAQEQNIDAIVLVETWLREAGRLPQPQCDSWSRIDLIHNQLDPRARRGSAQLAEKYAQEFRAVTGKEPEPKERDAMRARATGVALRKSACLSHEASLKLLRLQNQDYDRPHSTAFLEDIGRWLTNQIPGAQPLPELRRDVPGK
jgi:hypothetical protein